jgi:hypothetical protein
MSRRDGRNRGRPVLVLFSVLARLVTLIGLRKQPKSNNSTHGRETI